MKAITPPTKKRNTKMAKKWKDVNVLFLGILQLVLDY